MPKRCTQSLKKFYHAGGSGDYYGWPASCYEITWRRTGSNSYLLYLLFIDKYNVTLLHNVLLQKARMQICASPEATGIL